MGQPVVHFEIGCRDRGRTGESDSKLFDRPMREKSPATMLSTGGCSSWLADPDGNTIGLWKPKA